MPTDFSHLYTTPQSGQVSAPPPSESAENSNSEAPTTPVSWHQLLHSWIHPVETEQAAEQGFQQHEEQVRQEADAKNQLYYADPVKYKEQYPISFYARKLHDVAAQALMDPALRNMSPALAQKLEPDIHALVDTGLGAYGVPSGEEPTSDIKQGVVAPEPLDFSEVEGLQTVKPAPEYLYHATDVSRVPAIEKEGLRAGTWFANSPEEALRSGAVPISGNRADLRVFRVPRSEFLEGTPAAEDIGARGVEKGKFKISGQPMKAEMVLTKQGPEAQNEGMKQTYYHGTGRNFKGFTGDEGRSTATGNPTGELGTFFTKLPEEANRYVTDFHGGKGQVVSAKLDLKHPYEMSMAEFNSLTTPKDWSTVTDFKEFWKDAKEKAKVLRQNLMAQGYDGIVIGKGGKYEETVVFHPEQIHVIQKAK